MIHLKYLKFPVLLGCLSWWLFSASAASTAYQLVLQSLPTNAVAGVPMNGIIVQVQDKGGTNVAQSGLVIVASLNKAGNLYGTTNLSSDAKGQVIFTNLWVANASTYTMTVAASGLKSATTAAFAVSKASTVTSLGSSTNNLVYGQTLILTAKVSSSATNAGVPIGSVTFKDGSATLGIGTLNSAGWATFTTNRIFATSTNHTLSAVYAGSTNFLTSTSSNLVQTVSKLALTVSGVLASNKIYDGTTNAALNFSNATLNGILFNDPVTLGSTTAKGYFLNKNVGTNKAVTVTGLTLTGTNTGNYTLVQPTTAGSITARGLTLTAKGVNRVYNGTTNATVTLTDNRITGDLFTNGYTSAAFVTKNVGTNIAINVSGLFINGTNAGNYALVTTTTSAAANITVAGLTVSGITASNRVYDRTTTAALNLQSASLVTIFGNDQVSLVTTNVKATFASKTVGVGKTVTISGLTLSGAAATNYTLTQPTTTATITARLLTVTAKGVNRVYNGTTNATATFTDNRVSGDTLTITNASAFFVSRNIGTNLAVTVSGLSLSGTDATNYSLTSTSVATTANITRAPLTIAGVTAVSKVYDRTTTATLDTSSAALVTVFASDNVTLNSSAAKGVFASKGVGTVKTVTITGFVLGGSDTNNYSLTQPTASASITALPLTLTAKGINKIYDSTTKASVTFSDNRVTGDVLTNSYATATFANASAGTNLTVTVTGLAITGTDATNYQLTATTATTTANISPALLTVAAVNASRAYGLTNPLFQVTYTGFITGENATNSDLTGAPSFATIAQSNSPVGLYPIVISTGSLASSNYQFQFTNSILTVIKATTTLALQSSQNPVAADKTITFTALVTPPVGSVVPAAGSLQFKANGTNQLTAALALTNGQASLTIVANILGQGDFVISAEFSDATGNFGASTNQLAQTITGTISGTAPPPSHVSLNAPSADGHLVAQVAGISGQIYVIQVSTDLMHWTSLATNVADSNGSISLSDTNTVNSPMRFYRAFSP